MLDLKNLLCAALAASLLLPAAEAEARFGKRSKTSDSEKEKKETKEDDEEREEPRSSGRVHDASPVDTSSRPHDASGVGSRPPPPPPPDSRPDTVVIVEEPQPSYYVAPPASHGTPSENSITGITRPEKVHYYMRLAFGGGPLGGGSGFEALLAFEGERMGLDGRVLGMSLPTEDGSGGTDGITVGGVHFTYALVAQDRLRWRAEAGISSASAPDISFVGPSLGTSLDARLVPSVDLESRVQVTPFPHRQLDAQLGLAYKPYPWAIRAGWRALVLDDAGRVDGVVHRDFFHGPYISFGLFL